MFLRNQLMGNGLCISWDHSYNLFSMVKLQIQLTHKHKEHASHSSSKEHDNLQVFDKCEIREGKAHNSIQHINAILVMNIFYKNNHCLCSSSETNVHISKKKKRSDRTKFFAFWKACLVTKPRRCSHTPTQAQTVGAINISNFPRERVTMWDQFIGHDHLQLKRLVILSTWNNKFKPMSSVSDVMLSEGSLSQ